MRHRVRDRWLQYGFTAGLIGAAAIIGFALHVIAVQAAWVNVAGEWDQYRLNESQKQLFKTVRPKRAGSSCCDIADGHPTQAEHRLDGWYVPNPFHTDWAWVRVPEDAFTTMGTNPVGVATLWYGTEQSDGTPYIRCFVPESEI
jgi:hypothetical protein